MGKKKKEQTDKGQKGKVGKKRRTKGRQKSGHGDGALGGSWASAS